MLSFQVRFLVCVCANARNRCVRPGLAPLHYFAITHTCKMVNVYTVCIVILCLTVGLLTKAIGPEDVKTKGRFLNIAKTVVLICYFSYTDEWSEALLRMIC